MIASSAATPEIESQNDSAEQKRKNPPRCRGGFSVAVIVSRRFLSLADLAVTYFSKP